MSDQLPEHRADALPQPAGLLFGNRAYDLIKFVALVLLPGIGAAYFAIAQLWGLPYADEVVGTIVVIDTFLGGLVGITASQYKKSDARFDGQVLITQRDEDTSDVNIQIPDTTPLATQDEVVLKVRREE